MSAKWVGRGALGLALLCTTVFAQGETKSKPATDANMAFRKGSQLTAAEQLTQADGYIRKMKLVQTRVKKLAKRARTNKDLIKLNCVNDKAVRITGNLRVGESLQNALKSAAARRDAAARNHEFAKLTITYQKVTVLSQEAEACIGEEISYVGKAKVVVEVDPEVAAKGDPTKEEKPGLGPANTPVASPFL